MDEATYPAHAGINLMADNELTVTNDLPRTRGDKPSGYSII